MAKLKTINVVEIEGNSFDDFEVKKVSTFPDTEDGKKEARDLFEERVRDIMENDLPEGYIHDCFEDGGIKLGEHVFYVVRSS